MVRGSSAGAMLNIKHNKPAKVVIRLKSDITNDINEKLEEKYDKERKRTAKNSFRQNKG